MISWISVALSGYFLLAFTGVADKFFVSKVVRQPVAYAFFTAITGPFSLILLLFGGKILHLQDFLVALLAGIFFIIGVYNSYSAISRSSVSRVVPIQAALIPIFSFCLAYFILDEHLNFVQTSGFLFLVVGAVLMSLRRDDNGAWTTTALFYASMSALFFALASVLTKYIFALPYSNFVTGMAWTRVGFIIPVPFMLLFKNNRKAIFNAPKEAGVKNVVLYYSSRATGTLGGFLQNYAVKLGSVSIVNAMQGVQFVFLLILTTFMSIYYPKVLKERIDLETTIIKGLAILSIGGGLLLLTR
jgi:drug/metabolite transporter (DMT)-like permease